MGTSGDPPFDKPAPVKPAPLPLPNEGAEPARRDLVVFPSASAFLSPISESATVVLGDPQTIVQLGAVDIAP